MFEVIGVIVVSLIALFAVVCFVGLPWLGLGFGGPSVINWAWMVGGLVAAGLIVLGWWNLVGTKIHMGFG
jgi:hypothetical protein